MVLGSDFCTCNNITADKLEGRDPGDPCNVDCKLGTAGYVSVFASLFYFLASGAVMKYGVQHEKLEEYISGHPELENYDHYTTRSIFSRIVGPSTKLVYDEPQSFSVPRRLSNTPINDFDLSKRLQDVDEEESMDEPESHSEDNTPTDIPGLKKKRIDDRSRCQKFCCDFRVAQRTRGEKIKFWVNLPSFQYLRMYLCVMSNYYNVTFQFK